jgi:hypothetical protein
MILLCSGTISDKAFDAMLFLAATLHERGHEVAIDSRFVPEDFLKQEKYEAAPFLVDHEDLEADKLVIVAANNVSDDVQLLLRSTQVTSDVRIWAFGRFETRQIEINATNRLAYALGREPEIVDLAQHQNTPLLSDELNVPVTVFRESPKDSAADIAQVLIFVPASAFENSQTMQQLVALGHQAGMNLHILTSGRGKTLIQNSRFDGLSVFGVSELPPLTLVNFADLFLVMGTNVPGPRISNLAVHVMASGNPVIDCTTNTALAETGAPVLEGPHDIQALAAYLSAGVLENRCDIGERAQNSDWLKRYDVSWIEKTLEITPKEQPSDTEGPATVFYPTNGNGLGHAQRCAVIAEAMDTDLTVRFAAFPSCTDLLRNRGFSVAPMVQRTETHSVEYANDLINYLRLRGILKAGDQFVFDGGYVFDSIYRIISELRLSAVWIRRGLWQSGQLKSSALERERVFSTVIVPQEAFEELNTGYSQGAHIHPVGPIVRDAEPVDPEIRKKLAKIFGRPAETVVVTMLGGGVASERSVQTQMMCNILEQRDNCIHLVVAWPNAIVPNGLYGWKNTHVIKTQNTGALCRAADLVVSAVGYNSFHEIMYSGIPSIMIPQFAPYLDDQERRARAASERGLTSLVLETELVRLKREVSAFLDDGKAEDIRAAFAQVELPPPGNQTAAQLIEDGLQS